MSDSNTSKTPPADPGYLGTGWYRLEVSSTEGDTQQIDTYFEAREIQFIDKIFRSLANSTSDDYSPCYKILRGVDKQVTVREWDPVKEYDG